MPIVFENILMPNASGGPNILTSVLPNGVQGTFYTFTMTASGGTLPYVWSLAGGTLDSGVTLSAAGILSGTPANAETDNIVIRVTDAHGLFITKAFSVTFTPIVNPLVINTTSPLPSGNEFNTYSTTLNASGGTPGYTWSIITGAFQTGITLNSATGVISGTPTQAGTDTVTIQVQDSVAATTSKVFSLTIAAPAALVITTTSPLPSGTLSTPYSQTLNATGGITPYIWTILSGSLQAGLTLSSGGTISGTPSVAATDTVTIQVQDNVGTTTSKTFTITVNTLGTVATPTFSPVAGTYTGTQTVAISCSTPSSSIYFTIDGTTPTFPITGTTTLYTGSLTVTANETIKAIGALTSWTNSAVATAAYVINLPVVATPTFSPVAGTYASTQTVSLSCSTAGSSIYYTIDGSTPTFPITGTTTLYSGPLTVSASETIRAIGAASGFTNSAVGSAAYVIGSVTTTIPNIAALSATFPSANVTAYNALNVPGMAAGTFFNDPTTGVVTCKITDSTTPLNGQWCPWYSQMGLAISQAWGTNLDQYHVIMCNTTSAGGNPGWVADYGFKASTTPGPRNYRNITSFGTNYVSGTASWSRKAGNPHILYTVVGAHIRLLDVTANSGAGGFVDSNAAALGYSASWPATGWPFVSLSSGQWFTVNDTETWATANAGNNTAFLAINLTTGAQISQANGNLGGNTDDTYTAASAGAGNFSTGDQQSKLWNLDTNTLIPYSQALGFTSSHMAAMRGFYACFNSSGSGSLPFPAAVIAQNTSATVTLGTQSTPPFFPKGSNTPFHTCGYWWLQPPTTGQYFLQSIAGVQGSQYPASESYALTFLNVWAGTGNRLGFTYGRNLGTLSGNSDASYYTQSWGHLSHDGKLVVFGSEMQTGTRLEFFVMEVPVISGTPPSFP